MKKNLKIVSAAAAALLAVAPVAASAVSSVNAAAVTSATQVGTVPALSENAKVNITPNVSLNTAVPGTNIKSALSASFTATVDGTTATSTLTPGVSSVEMWYNENGARKNINKVEDVANSSAGSLFKVQLNKVTLNFGDANANKDITLVLPNENGNHFGNSVSDLTFKTKTNANGVAEIPYVVLGVYAKDFANPAIVNWYSKITGATVTSGDLTLTAGSDAGKMNVAQVLSAAEAKYAAGHIHAQSSTTNYTTAAELADQLKKQGISVDAQGWFVAPKSFTFNLKATATNNDASATLPITVTVTNGKETAANEVTKNVTVMHIATIYDKNGKATTEPVLRAYNTVSVVSEPVTINGAKFYKLAGKDQYIKVGNIDGTKRTLKHNAYVYKSNGKAYTHKVGKKAKKTLTRKGSEVTTYGKSFMIHGSQMWRIGKNQYIKVANF